MIDKTRWQQVKFGEVVRLNTERVADPIAEGVERYVGLEHLTPEDLRIRSWGLVAEGTTFTNAFRPGQVLFGKRRAYQRKVAVADFSGVCSGDIYVFEPKDPQVLLPELLPFICQTDGFFKHAVGTSAGSLSPRTNWTQLANYEFALPPLEEQRRIVKVLKQFEILSESLKIALESAQKNMYTIATNLLRQDVLRPLFLKQGVNLPKGWALSCFEEVTERITYGFTNPMPTTKEGPWMVTAKDIQDGYIDYDTARHTSKIPFLEMLTEKSRPKINDVLITKDGTLGRVAIVDREEICINQSVALLRPNGKASPEFIAWSLRAPVMQWRLMLDVGGSAVQHLYITKIAQTKFLLPSLQVQSEIVSILNQAEDACFAVKNRLKSTNQLKSVQLNKLFGDAL